MQSKVQVWVFQKAGKNAPIRVLLLKMRQDRGGYWQPVTGSVEKHETFGQAALREASEETGVPFIRKPVDSGYEFEFEGRRGRTLEKVFSLEVPEDLDPQKVVIDPNEHTAFQWMDPKSARQILSFESNQVGLDRVSKTLGWPK